MEKKSSMFMNTILRMQDDATELRKMIPSEIPEAFPTVETPIGSDPNFVHNNETDFPGLGQNFSVLQDSLTPLDVIERLEEKIYALSMIVEDLFPKKLSGMNMEMEIGRDFQSIKDNIVKYKEALMQIRQIITQMQHGQAIKAIDRKALRELKDHITVIGYEYVHNNFQVPDIFKNSMVVLQNKNMLQKIDQMLPPQIQQFSTSMSKPNNIISQFKVNSTILPNNFLKK